MPKLCRQSGNTYSKTDFGEHDVIQHPLRPLSYGSMRESCSKALEISLWYSTLSGVMTILNLRTSRCQRSMKIEKHTSLDPDIAPSMSIDGNKCSRGFHNYFQLLLSRDYIRYLPSSNVASSFFGICRNRQSTNDIGVVGQVGCPICVANLQLEVQVLREVGR